VPDRPRIEVADVPNKSCYFFRTTGSPEATFNQGPWNVGTINKLFHVKLSGSIFAGFTTFESEGFFLDNPTLIGVQMIAHGGTPLDLVSAANDYRWLMQGAPDLGEETIELDSTISSFNYAIQASLGWEFFGQMPVGINVDFYLSVADAWGTAATWEVGGMLQVDWN
jgi:hypothetical protein